MVDTRDIPLPTVTLNGKPVKDQELAIRCFKAEARIAWLER